MRGARFLRGGGRQPLTLALKGALRAGGSQDGSSSPLLGAGREVVRRLLCALFVTALAWGGAYPPREVRRYGGERKASVSAPLRRLVSLAPSVTETIFALGGGDRLVGVTRYCSYPPEARKIAKIGGYIDPSLEAILRLRPDLVVVTVENREIVARLKGLGLKTLVVNQNTLSGILESFVQIGEALGEEERARKIVSGIRKGIERIRRRTEGLPKPRVLLSMGRAMGADVNEVYAAREGTFFDEIIGIAGGVNVCRGDVLKVPVLSGEGLIRLNPEVILDLVPEGSGSDTSRVLADWKAFSHLAAVRNRRVYALTGDYVVVPGPRLLNILEDVAKAVHPEVPWSRP